MREPGIAFRPSRTWPPDRLTTVLFDLDDTLIDSFNARVVALYQVFESFDIHDQAASEFMRGSGGKQLKTALAELETKLGISVGLYESYRESYWTKFTDTIRPYSGVKQLLSEIRIQGLSTGVVTQKSRGFQIKGRSAGAARELKHAGLSDMFPTVIGMEDVRRYKPHPEGIRLAMELLVSSPEHTLMVGDSFPDIEAGRAAGCWTCHATWGLPEDHRTLDGLEPDIVAATPAELSKLISAQQAI